ncbi:GlxA family transcriptional regulator [Erwinia phyllosphaerae]|uniref:GlxA family transcriptional regulator n=1 Tax=Erwinia phyllosphaerae TaxID=2853256 RepID=UPI001FEF08E1|nr:helix-turn-helix domain-containing protein [Erwinia phyllosphaerae]MBV4367486.1 helix-turn-helix domain-containing protein [Erwinia phyllosphaerae]
MAIPVWFLTLPGVMTLDITGPAETLQLAGDAFELRYIGPEESVMTSTRMTVSQLEPLPESLPEGSLLIIPGMADSSVDFDTPASVKARNWLTRMQPIIHAGRITLVCICSGSILAARSGLLYNVQCTTHHEVIERLRSAEPTAIVKENRIFVEDNGIWTSAGITAGIDLALHLIQRLCGSQAALNVAREMVVWFRRSDDDPQLSPWLRHRNHINPAIHRTQDLLIAQPERVWPLEEIANRVHVSARHLTRLFRQHLGISVREYHEQLKLAMAKQRLQQGEGTEKAALAAGFTSSRQLRRAIQRWAN